LSSHPWEMTVAERKRELRTRLLAVRLRLPPQEREEAALQAAEHLQGLAEFGSARTVALYSPLGSEIDPGSISARAAATGKRVLYPRVVPNERRLVFAACPPEDLVAGPLGTREPPPQAPTVPLASIDLVVVPGLAFDSAGRRLGRGRGFYDTTLAALGQGTLRVGLAFELQIIPVVPHEPHDSPLDVVVTERRVMRCRTDCP